jgi:hypothetical protein
MTESLAGLAAVLAHLTWLGAVVALAAFLALRLVGPRAGAARYRIAMAALVLLTLAPAGTLARRGGWLAGTSPGWVAAVPEWTRPAATPDPSPAPIDAPPAMVNSAGWPRSVLPAGTSVSTTSSVTSAGKDGGALGSRREQRHQPPHWSG